MALVLKDRVKVLATTTGTGAFTLGSAVTGYQDFSVIGDGNTTYYTIAAQATPDWEVGIGTYTASGTLLSRDTILESSNGGAAVDFPAGTKDVFVTYPAERAVYEDAAGDYPVQNTFGTLNAANAVLTAGTISTTPVSATDIANKTYVDTIAAAGIHYHAPVRVESPDSAGSLNATYNNGTAGVGATLTNAGTQVALVIDGVTLAVNDRVLIYNQTNATQNGVYVVTDTGSGSTNWVLTRASDADTYAPSDPDSLGQGDAFYVTSGNTGAGETYVCNTPGTITFGTTNITFAQISSAQIYSAGTGLTLSGTQFSLSNTGTAGTYGNASNVPVFTTNAQGQVTSVTDTAIAIAAGAVSGLAASATTDTTNASNITSGTLPTGRLTGSYTGVTGVGTLTAGTWNGSTIGATYGGTGLSSFAAGDIIYADSSTTLARLADTAVGNALISGGAAADPSWGKIGLATHVDGILPVANGGTGNATNQAASVANSATFNNGGAGAASGSTFNGSSPLTISYNTLGAYPTTNPAGYTSNTGTVTSVGGTGTVNGLTLTGTVTTSGNLTLGGTLSGIANAALTNSSVTVNGTSIALGASGTITANNPNALTINNGGAGAASGTTYNGSSAITISYNTVGAPSTTGTGASGSWNISVTGSAGTALSSPLLSALGNYVWAASTLPTSFNAGIQTSFVQPADGWPNYGSVITTRTYSGGGGSLQMYVPYGPTNGGTGLQVRFGNYDVSGGNSWTAWKTLLASDNYNSYALPLAGGNMTGLLATVGNTAAFTSANDTTLSVRSSGTGTAASMSFHRPGAYAVNLGLDTDNIFKLGGWSAGGVQNYWDFSGNAYATGSMRAPIFYDLNDTGYYVDPANVSNLNYVGVQRAAAGYDAGQTGSFSCSNWFRSSGSSGWFNASYGGGVWMQGGTFVEVYGGKAFYVANQVQGTIFYDANDTGWYCDPNSTSNFNRLSLPSNAGSGTFPMSISSVDRGIVFGNSSGSGIPCYFTVNSGGTVSGSIIASGGSTSFNTSSDYRMKENDVGLDTSAALAKIMSLRPVTFDWKEQFGGRKGIGFIAHELDLVAPECVNGEKDAVNDDGTINPQSVDTSWLIPSMCSAMQKQQEMIEQLSAQIAALKGI